MTDKTLLYLYDLPKDLVSSVKISAKIKELTKYELPEAPQIRRDPNKPFYTAILKINEPEKFKEVANAMKYFDIEGKPCRALPYTKELTAANRAHTNKNNVFIKGLDKNINSASLEKTLKEKVGDVVTAKVSINPDYTSRGYGFVLFQNQEDAQKAIQKSKELGLDVNPYQPKDRRDLRKSFNNIYVKNFPETWDEAKLRSIFGKYGTIKSLALMKAKVPGTDTEAPFSFICFEDPSDKEYGPKCAMNAVQQENEKEYDGHKIYVKEALKKTEREAEKKREQLRFKNSKKRCNLYVKNFPPATTEAELRDYFAKYGEIESIKLLPKEGEALYAFVCYKSPDSAALAKQQLNQQTFNGKQLYINHYELKEVRKIQQEDARDKADFQSLKKQQPSPLTMDILNKPEIYQLIQYMMVHIQRQQQHQQHRQGGFQNRQGGQQRGPRQNFGQNQMQRPGPQGQPGMPGQMPPQPGMMMPPQPGMRPPMPGQFQQPPPQMMNQAMNLPPHILEYNQNGFKLLPAVSPQNPNYKAQVGEFIYEYVERIAGEAQAPKITGMLIDLPIPEIQAYLTDFNKLTIKINEANTLLSNQPQ